MMRHMDKAALPDGMIAPPLFMGEEFISKEWTEHIYIGWTNDNGSQWMFVNGD